MASLTITLEDIIEKKNSGKFGEALELVELYLKKEKLEDDKLFEAQKLRILILKDLRKFSESSEFCNSLLENLGKTKNELKIIKTMLVKAEILVNSGETEEFFSIIKEIELRIKENFKADTTDFNRLQGHTLHLKAESFFRRNLFSEAIDISQRSLELREKTGIKEDICYSLDLLSTACFWVGKVDEGLVYVERALKILEEYKNPFLKLEVQSVYSNLQIHKGNYELAVSLRRENQRLAKELDLESLYYTNKITESWPQIYLGNYQLAEDLASEGIKYFIENKPEFIGSLDYNFLSLAQIALGKYNEALENAYESLRIAEEMEYPVFEAIAIARLGEVYRRLGDIEKALEFRLRSVDYFSYFKSQFHKAHILVDLIEIFLDKNELTEAEKYLEVFKQAIAEEKIDFSRHRYLYCEAQIYMKKSETRDKGKGEILLEKLLEEEGIEFALKIQSLFSLCNFYLTEFQISGDEALGNKLNKYLKQLIELAKDKQLINLLIEIYLLQSKLASVNVEIQKAQNYLEKALTLAEIENYEELSIKVKNEQSLLSSRLKSWREIISDEKPLIEKLKTVNINETLATMKKQIDHVVIEENRSDPVKLTKIFSLKI